MEGNIAMFEFNLNKEQSLWKAVILQAFIDLKNNSKKKIANTYKIKAVLWFNLENKDFLTACEYANLNPFYVWSTAEKIKDKIFF